MSPTPCLTLLLVVCGLGFGFGQTDDTSYSDLQYLPGDKAHTVNEKELDQILSDLVTKNGGTHIRVALGVASLSHTLTNPRWHLSDGSSKFSVPQQISAYQTGLILFQKSVGIMGVHGVLTYDIEGTQLILAIFVSLPENSILYDRMFNIKLYHNDAPVDVHLVDQMYEYAGAWVAGNRGQRREYGVKVTGTMTNKDKATQSTFMDASGYNIRLGPSRYSKCEFRTSVLGYRCWRECTPTGWCWTYEPCNYNEDCDGKMFCEGACETV